VLAVGLAADVLAAVDLAAVVVRLPLAVALGVGVTRRLAEGLGLGVAGVVGQGGNKSAPSRTRICSPSWRLRAVIPLLTCPRAAGVRSSSRKLLFSTTE
jgi:hypothetical protein